MVKKTNSLKKIPMKPHRYYDDNKGWVETEFLTHCDYVGDQGAWVQTDVEGYVKFVYNPVLVDNVPFEKSLKYDGFYRGRSAAGLIFKDSGGIPYTVFLGEFVEFVPLMIKGEITAKFWYIKRGRSYGIGIAP